MTQLLLSRARTAAEFVSAAFGKRLQIEQIRPTFGAPPIAGLAFSLASGSGGLALARICPVMSAALLQAVTGSACEPIPTRPDPVSAAVLGHGVLVGLNAIAESGLSRPRLLSVSAPIAKPAVVLQMVLRLEESVGHAQIILDERAARGFIDSLSGDGEEAATASSEGALHTAASFASMRINAAICMGPVRLAASSVRTLVIGDAICPDPEARLVDGLPRGSAFLDISNGARGRVAPLGELADLRLTIDSIGIPKHRGEEVPVSSIEPARSLAMDVHIVLASLPMTLGEISSLGVGSVIELAGHLPRVKIRVGDQTLALGELVDVEGTLGVRIVGGDS